MPAFSGVMYMGVKSSFFPCMMFLAVGAMTDFGPLIANPISLLLGAAAQLGIYCAFIFANATGLFTPQQAAAIGIIGGADGRRLSMSRTTSLPSWSHRLRLRRTATWR